MLFVVVVVVIRLPEQRCWSLPIAAIMRLYRVCGCYDGDDSGRDDHSDSANSYHCCTVS